MLYVTTRVERDAFTAFRALSENRGPEGGFFVPIQLPSFDKSQITTLAEKSFSQNLAEIINLFFGTRINGPDLELNIGRYPVTLVPINGKITVVNTWNNPVYRFERLLRGVEKSIFGLHQEKDGASNWLCLATRIGVLFGAFGMFLKSGILEEEQKMDIAFSGADLSLLMAAWYARRMGLPIGTIVCCCSENSGLWSLLHKGEVRTDILTDQSNVLMCDDSVPVNLERLIFSTLGFAETLRFCDTCRTGGVYAVEPEQLQQLCDGIHVSVVSGKRMASTIPNLYKTTGFVSDPYTALAYSGLIDDRAATGSRRQACIISEESPYYSLEFVAQCMNMPLAELKRLLK